MSKKLGRAGGQNINWLAGSAIVALLSASPAAAQDRSVPDVQAPPTGAAPSGEVSQATSDGQDIVVTGVRESLRSGINEKRRADNFSDVIKAQDIGELPDNSIADSLQRITGVQVVRNIGASREGQSGQPVSIRGLPSLALINGRTLLAGPIGRDVDFRTLASEGFGELVISKSPTADRIEGGLGGTIELKTRNPLDFPKGVTSLTVQGSYLDYGDTFNPSVSGLISRTFLDNRVGILLSGSFQKRRIWQDQFQARDGWRVQNGYTGSGYDFDKNGTADLITPSDLRLGIGDDHQTRYGADGTLTFAATDELTLRVDGSYSRFSRDWFNGVFRVSGLGGGNLVAGSGVVDDKGSLLKGTFLNQLIQADGRLEMDVVYAYNYGFNADWKRDRLHVTFDVAESVGGTKGRQLINRFQLLTPQTVSYDFGTDNPVPDIVVGSGINLADRSLYRTDLTNNDLNRGRNRELSSRFDVTYDLDGWLTSLSAGSRFTRANYRASLFPQVQQANNVANAAVYDPVTGLRRTAAYVGLDPLFRGFPSGPIFQGTGGNFPREWLYTSYPSADINSSGDYADIYNLDAAGRVENLNARVNLREKTYAGYVRADLEGAFGSLPFRGNVGVRVVKTEESSLAYQALPQGGSGFATDENNYTDVLPSATMIFNLRDDLLLRAAAGKVMRRPDLQQLHSPIVVERSSLTATAGNINLKPFQANQGDIALEWYFARDGVLSGTLFYKDVKNFIAVTTQRDVDLGIPGFNGTTIYTVTRPVNAGSAKIKGFELNYQHAFTFLPAPFDKLGIVANYTFSDAKTTSGQSFLNLSRHVVNVIGYYDAGNFDFRLAYNWRSRYASLGDGSNGLQFLNIDEFVRPAGQLDLSSRYDITKNLSVQFEALNLTNADFLRYSGYEARNREYRVEGRTYALSLRAQF
jgi:iron complex outermembrane receptor protein